MKKFNINSKKEEFKWGVMEVICLGEQGRGRIHTYVPFHANKESEHLDTSKTLKGNFKIVNSESEEGWLARINCSGTYTRGTYGTAYVSAQHQNNIEVIAWGKGAYGTAGRTGSYMDYLCKIKEGTLIKVRPSGGSHKRPRYWLYFGQNEVVRIEKEEMEMFCESKNIYQPSENFDDLIDLSIK